MKKIFLDTNLLVYGYDQATPEKQKKSRAAVASLDGVNIVGVISTQVMQEFYNTLVRKIRISGKDAVAELHNLLLMEVVIITPDIIFNATNLHASASLSFWDSLIIAAAQSAHCDELWSEDMQDGRVFGALKIVNPFVQAGPVAPS